MSIKSINPFSNVKINSAATNPQEVQNTAQKNK